MKEARQRGSTILISSHQLSAIEDLCDTVGMLHNKNVTIVTSPGRAGAPSAWTVRCAGDARIGALIERITAMPAAFRDNAWHFEVTEPQATIPLIVSALAGNGCRIMEVRPETDSLKDRIQNSRAGGGV